MKQESPCQQAWGVCFGSKHLGSEGCFVYFAHSHICTLPCHRAPRVDPRPKITFVEDRRDVQHVDTRSRCEVLHKSIVRSRDLGDAALVLLSRRSMFSSFGLFSISVVPTLNSHVWGVATEHPSGCNSPLDVHGGASYMFSRLRCRLQHQLFSLPERNSRICLLLSRSLRSPLKQLN